MPVMTIDIFENPFIIPLLATVLVQLIFFLGVFLRLAIYRKRETADTKHPVSIIICAKNEEENLQKHLPKLLAQDYPEFEIIVADDQSEDNTRLVIEEFAAKDNRLKAVILDENIRDHRGKKLALSLAIRKAKYEYLLLTDADCEPVSDQWISLMIRNYTPEKEIVLGYSPYKKRRGLLNYLVQYESFYTALQYLSFSLAKVNYMGVGRNLSYKRQLFTKTGFKSHLHVPYGDDDLFVNEAATQTNVAIEIDKNAHMQSEPPLTFSQWYRQKRRHLKGGKEYKTFHKRLLATLWLSNILFYLAFGLALYFSPLSIWVWGAYGLRFLVMMIVYGLVLHKLNNIRLLWLTWLMDIFVQIIYLPFISLVAQFSRKESVW